MSQLDNSAARSSTRPHRRRPGYKVLVGDLRADPRELATIVLAGCIDGQITVWADEDQSVYMAAEEPAGVSEHWIVGVYLLGTASEDIERDITAMRHLRMKDWVMD
jgi:hypothetical protein